MKRNGVITLNNKYIITASLTGGYKETDIYKEKTLLYIYNLMKRNSVITLNNKYIITILII
jgi:hypothetical protein